MEQNQSPRTREIRNRAFAIFGRTYLRELSARAEMSEGYVSRLINDKTPPTSALDTLETIIDEAEEEPQLA